MLQGAFGSEPILEARRGMATIRSLDVVSMGAGHYGIKAGGRLLAGPKEASDPQTIIRFAQDFARERGWKVSMVPHGGVGRYELADPVPLPEGDGPALTTVELTLEVTPQFVRFLDEMGAEMGLDREDVVRLALGLLRIGLDAKREGNKLAIVTPELEFDQEVTGF